MRLLLLVTAASVICSASLAGSAEKKSAQTKMEPLYKECEKRAIQDLAVPSQAKVWKRLQFVQHASDNAVKVCIDAANRMGGRAVVLATCNLSADNTKITNVNLNDSVGPQICAIMD